MEHQDFRTWLKYLFSQIEIFHQIKNPQKKREIKKIGENLGLAL